MTDIKLIESAAIFDLLKGQTAIYKHELDLLIKYLKDDNTNSKSQIDDITTIDLKQSPDAITRIAHQKIDALLFKTKDTPIDIVITKHFNNYKSAVTTNLLNKPDIDTFDTIIFLHQMIIDQNNQAIQSIEGRIQFIDNLTEKIEKILVDSKDDIDGIHNGLYSKLSDLPKYLNYVQEEHTLAANEAKEFICKNDVCEQHVKLDEYINEDNVMVAEPAKNDLLTLEEVGI